ncbi:hypothetical protein [Acinetobacter sp. TGL-Y2]|uniref:hypothetical protein n=1 Tax=Acinetobacter sp. TGL-Y2 TaxID=1407071 RepID=UPI0019054941|nr:hypothetical protein [Acinetobacter sp. TGL-Y2]MBJ9373018.1 hypothetical protein [Acinetobacter sp. TGL-Y2]
MNSKLITTLLMIFVLSACSKEPDQNMSKQSDRPTVTAQFEQSDEMISKYLDQLDDPNTTLDDKKRIVCIDYPKEYKTNYMPSLLKLNPENYTQAKLLSDLDIALSYYKEKENIECKSTPS